MAVDSLNDLIDALMITSLSDNGARMEIKPEAARLALKRLQAYQEVLALINPMSLGEQTGLLLEIHDIIVKAIK